MEDPDNLKKHAKKAMPRESRCKDSWIWMATAQGAEGDTGMHNGKHCTLLF